MSSLGEITNKKARLVEISSSLASIIIFMIVLVAHTLFRRGAPGQGADEVSTAIHGGAAAVQKGDTFPPKNTNKPSLTPLLLLLKSSFWASKTTL